MEREPVLRLARFAVATAARHDNRDRLARCFLRLADLPNYPLDRLSRYEAILWRQAGQILSLSMHWIAANHKKEGAVSVSVGGKTCRPMAATTLSCRTQPSTRSMQSSAAAGERS